MKLTTLSVGSIGTNCYIIYREDTGSAVVIDPSDDVTLVLARLQALNLKVRAIVLTHAHFDHGGAADQLRTETGAAVWAHPADRALPSWLTHRLEWTDELRDGQSLCFDGIELQVNARNRAAYEMYTKCGFREKSINMELVEQREEIQR